ncbi:hypothetical protein [Paenibacillus sp. IHBB 10380]|uniref:hypothetical protein n=1 Tax=Paenibacillus sp. IHBB 10380 TaxID=1566358 RepID=UPI0005CFC626|nr:hypothetical protein [Paenibacillus sp. IHBB 10380]AJS57356.1 hypothetical protein UB51_01290 [Paenibacillus sp. IHBB 10380]
MELYFKDNFFNAGISDLMNEAGEPVGSIDLKSAIGSSLDVYDSTGAKVCGGKFRFLSNKWGIIDNKDELMGVLRARMSFFSKKYEYDAGNRGTYEITSPAFSKEYNIQSANGETVVTFARVNGWLQPGAYGLHNKSSELNHYELVAVVMGVHEIQKRSRSNSSAG